jgi:hypothetical protein
MIRDLLFVPNGPWFTRLAEAEREPGAGHRRPRGAGQQVTRHGADADDGKTPAVARDHFGEHLGAQAAAVAGDGVDPEPGGHRPADSAAR